MIEAISILRKHLGGEFLAAGMTQSMSRVARCIDNGPMEGFWGLMKREMYYGKKYKNKRRINACHRKIHRLLHKQKSSTKSWGAYTTEIP